MKIYGIPQSRAGRCLWMARELGLEHENVPVHFRATRDSPELVKVNPNARIPALEEPGGFTLHESMAINLYLVKKHGAATPIAPASLEEDALATQWSFWVMTEIEKPLLTLLMTTLAPTLAAISAGSVFMGANTYIGNAPNFMVKAIAEDRGIKMPSFFGYMLWSCGILVPLFVVMTFVWFA